MRTAPTKNKKSAKADPVLPVGDEATIHAGSSDAAFLDDVDDVTADELGDPLVTSSAREEAAGDASAPPDAEQESFPSPHHGRVRGEE